MYNVVADVVVADVVVGDVVVDDFAVTASLPEKRTKFSQVFIVYISLKGF